MTDVPKLLKMYGAQWCADCRRTKQLLQKYDISYEYIDIDTIAGAADKVTELNKGLSIIPTLVFSDDTVMAEPTNAEIIEKLHLS